MLYNGSVLAGSLHDESILNFVDSLRREATPAGDLITFVVKDELAPSVADELSRLLKSGQSYASVKNETDIYAVFPNKVFHFMPKELEKRQKALDYAKTLQISESQLGI